MGKEGWRGFGPSARIVRGRGGDRTCYAGLVSSDQLGEITRYTVTEESWTKESDVSVILSDMIPSFHSLLYSLLYLSEH